MKSFDLPITHNPLKTRDDVAKALLQMLKPCKDQLVLEGGGLFVGNSDAHYSSRVALMEGWSRLLWGIGPLMKGGFEFDDFPAFFEVSNTARTLEAMVIGGMSLPTIRGWWRRRQSLSVFF